MNPFKKRPHIEKMNEALAKKGLPRIEKDWWDRLYQIFLFTCIFYYLADTLIKLYEMRYPEDLQDKCKVGFFSHHLATMFGFKSVFFNDHYPWFLAGPMCYHTVIVTFPHLGLINNVIYMIFVAAFMLHSFIPPFKDRRHYRVNFVTGVLIVIPLAFLAYNQCMEDFDWDA